MLAGDIPFESYDWIPPLGIELSMRMDTLGWVMALIVTGVGALVMLYCRWYFRDKTDGVGQFSAVLLAFAGAMYGLVLTDDLVVLVMFWELTSVLSYLLIGYYNRRAASRRAALQALLVTTARRTRDAHRRRAAGRRRRHVEPLDDPRRGADRARSSMPRSCSCSSARSASPRSSRSTSGCPARWRRPPR